jgi:hypothetical protein
MLPKVKSEVKRKNPKILLLYGKPKIGKTTIVAGLENNLIIDLENGTDFVESLSIKADNLGELKAIVEEIRQAGHPYDYITVDNVTVLQDMVIGYAGKLYKDTVQGKNWTGDNVTKLPNGAGYMFLREAFFNVIDEICSLAEHIILIGHLKDKLINKAGEEISAAEIDLTGKISSLLSAKADALGYVYRKDNQDLINFNPSDQVVCGTRINHLANKQIVVSEANEKGEVKTFWERIYIK